MIKGFMLFLVIAYSGGPNTGASALVVETREFSKEAQCEAAAAKAMARASAVFGRSVAWCVARDISLDDK